MELYKIVYSDQTKSFGLMTLTPEQRDSFHSNVEGKDVPYINFKAAKAVAVGDTYALDEDLIEIHQCPECGIWFVTNKDEELWFMERGWPIPKRCHKCRRERRVLRVKSDEERKNLSNSRKVL